MLHTNLEEPRPVAGHSEGDDLQVFGAVARSYWSRGLPVMPLHRFDAVDESGKLRGKAPFLSGWQRYCAAMPTPEERADWLARYGGHNIGLPLGPQSRMTVIDIDSDAPAVIQAIRDVLPPSPWKRKGRKGFVLAYRWAGVPTFRIHGAGGDTIVEHLSHKTQVVLPPSIHPDTRTPYTSNCELYEVLEELLPLEADIEQRLRAGLEAIGIELGRSRMPVALTMPVLQGGRDNALVGWAGSMSRDVMNGHRVLSEVLAQVDWTSTTQLEQVDGDIIDPAKGRAKLLEFFVRDARQRGLPIGWDEGLDGGTRDLVVNEVAADLTPFAQALEELHDEYHFLEGGKSTAIIRQRTGSTGRAEVITHGKQQIKDQLAPMSLTVSTPKGPKKVNPADTWLNSANRKNIQGVVFDPANRTDGTYLNLWQGWSVEPKAGDWSLFEELLRRVAANDNEENFRYLIGWFAHMVQRPAEKPEVAVVLRGLKGTGKTKIADVLGSLCRPHYWRLDKPDQLTNKFNAWQRDCLLVSVEEAVWAGDKAAEGTLKSLITSVDVPLELKGKDVIMIKNYTRVLYTSNEDWVVPTTWDERRFFVLDVSEARKRDTAFFAALDRQMNEEGGLAALLYDLQKYDLTGFNVRNPPITDGLRDQMIRSLGAEDAWWFNLLLAGVNSLLRDRWEAEVSADDVHRNFKALAPGGRARYRNDGELGKFLARCGVRKQRSSKGTRPYVYVFPSLGVCRKAWEVKYGLQDWGDEAAEAGDIVEIRSVPAWPGPSYLGSPAMAT